MNEGKVPSKLDGILGVMKRKDSRYDKYFDYAAVLVAAAACIFQMLTASPLLVLSKSYQSGIHWGFICCYFLLKNPSKWKGGRIIDLLLAAFSIYSVYTLIQMRSSLVAVGGLYTDTQKLVAGIQLLVTLYVGYRAMGKVLPGICVIFTIYTLYGYCLSGGLKAARVSWGRFTTYLMVGTEGMFGTALNTAANFIFVFVFFGAVLGFIGAGEYFVDLAYAAFGRMRGGPAQASIYSSMLLGMVNGSGPANVVTTGTFTIPLMKKTGIDSNTAGAIEAVASNGGQLMPPVMGAVAFLMADATSIPYAKIAVAAFLPAVLYYTTLSFSVVSYSYKNSLPKAEKAHKNYLWSVFVKGWYYFIPIVLLVYLLVSGYSTQRSALLAILLCLVIGAVKDRKKFTVKNLCNVAQDAVGSMVSVSTACLLAGIIIGAVNITGLGLKISGLVTAMSGGHLIVLALLTAAVCIIMGMGLPTSACYIILSVLIVPALIEFGVSKIAAHMFILYFGTISNLTPPVALAVFAAIGISGGDMWKTGLQAMKLGAAGFLVPFIFIYDDLLLMQGELVPIIFTMITAFMGCSLLAVILFGWAFRSLKAYERIILLPCSLFLIVPRPLGLNLAGMAIAGLVLVNLYRTREKTGWKESVRA